MHVRRVALRSCISLSIALVAALGVAAAALANLPDHRAYEMVSPVEKGGQSFVPELVLSDASGEHALVDGGVYNSPLSNGASWMLETRTSTGWGGPQIGPASVPGASYQEQEATFVVSASEDLSQVAFQTLMSIDPRDQGPSYDLYRREGANGPLTWVTGPPAPTIKVGTPALGNYVNGAPCLNPIDCYGNSTLFAGGSTDLSTMVWSQRTPMLAPPAALPGSLADTHAYGYEVYSSANGAARLVGLIPSEGTECNSTHGSCVVPRCGAAMGNVFYSGNGEGYGGSEGFATIHGAVSGDGSQVVFTSPDPNTEVLAGCPSANIYVREDGSRSVEVSASQKSNGFGVGGVDPNGPRRKLYKGTAGEDGQITTVYFTSQEELTNDANTGADDQGNDLYAYSLQSGQLTDLTPDSSAHDSDGADVSEFIGSSTDGSLVYFTATGMLAPGASAGQTNLYVRDIATGQTTFIADGAGIQGHIPGSWTREVTSQLTPDGRHLVFVSNQSLTSYKQEGDAEIYLYDEPSPRLTCVSCNPSGEPPLGNSSLPPRPGGGYFYYPDPATLPNPLVVSDDGSRVFFTSGERLTVEAPAPTLQANPYLGLKPNAYEYEDGHVYLIAPEATFLGATPSGNDAFVDTVAQLSPQDGDGTVDVYDARVDGGFPSLAPPACSGTSCQGVPASPPLFATPPSVTFSGVGNFPPTTPLAAGVKAKQKTKAKSKKPKQRKKSKQAKHKRAKQAKKSHERSNKGGK
jgi:hypothetical protein